MWPRPVQYTDGSRGDAKRDSLSFRSPLAMIETGDAPAAMWRRRAWLGGRRVIRLTGLDRVMAMCPPMRLRDECTGASACSPLGDGRGADGQAGAQTGARGRGWRFETQRCTRAAGRAMTIAEAMMSRGALALMCEMCTSGYRVDVGMCGLRCRCRRVGDAEGECVSRIYVCSARAAWRAH